MATQTKIQLRRDTAANWVTHNPTLSAGEPGFEVDTGKLKIGDGKTTWANLVYVDNITTISASKINCNGEALDGILSTYIFNVDYENLLAFDTSELVVGSGGSNVLGQAILGQLILA